MSTPSTRARLQEEIKHLENYKQILEKDIKHLHDIFGTGRINTEDYHRTLSLQFADSSPYDLLDHYKRAIARRQKDLEQLSAIHLTKNTLRSFLPVFAVFVLLAATFILVRPTITGFVVGPNENLSIDRFNLELDENYSFVWTPDVIGELETVRLNGLVKGYGNLSVSISDGTLEKIIYSIEVDFDETQHKPEGSGPQNVEDGIDLILEYGNHELWDTDNNGFETERGVIDLSVAQTSFEFVQLDTQTCTLWSIESLDEETVTSVCYGDNTCCMLTGLKAQENTMWNDPLYLYMERLGATNNNRVHARVIFEQGLNESLFSDIEWVSATFEPTPEMILEQECIETCSGNLSASTYTVTVNVNGLYLELDSFSYNTREFANLPPIQSALIPDQLIQLSHEARIVLSDYINDPDNDMLSVQVSDANANTALLDGILNIHFDETGNYSVYLIVSDELHSINTNTFNIEVTNDNVTLLKPIVDSEVVKELERNVNARVIIKLRGNATLTNEILEKQRIKSTKLEWSPKKKLNIEAGLIHHTQLDSLMIDPRIEEIILDQPVSIHLEESLPQIRANLSAYNLSQNGTLNGTGVRVCVVDTGVDYNYNDNYAYGYDFVNHDSSPLDDHGHGTLVSSVISAVAPGIDLIAVKVLNDLGEGYESDVLAGIQYCIDEDVDIISLSIGSGGYAGLCNNNIVADLVNEAWAGGTYVVASSGNYGDYLMTAPACASNVTSVSAVDNGDYVWSGASINNLTHVLAPGVDITATGIFGFQETHTGTSMSAAFVSGASALLIQDDSLLEPAGIDLRVRESGVEVVHDSQRYPRLDVASALSAGITFNLANLSANETEPEIPAGNYFTLLSNDNLFCSTDGDSLNNTCVNTCGGHFNGTYNDAFTWESQAFGNYSCCGDDLGEYYVNRTCVQGCYNLSSDDACCNNYDSLEFFPKRINDSHYEGSVLALFHFTYDNYGQMFLEDYSDNNNYGVYSPSPVIDETGNWASAHTFVKGVTSYAINLSEVNIHIYGKDPGLYTHLWDGITFEILMKMDSFPEEEVLYRDSYKEINITEGGYVKWAIDYPGVGWNVTTSGYNLTPGQWHLVTVTYDNSDKYMRIYIDGNLSATPEWHNVTYLPGQNNAYIGYADNNISVYIDEMRILDYPLSAYEVKQMYEFYNNTYLLCHFYNNSNATKEITGVTVIIEPIEDTYIFADNPNTNYDSATGLRVEEGVTAKALLNFNTTLIPSDITVDSSTGLKVYGYGCNSFWCASTSVYQGFKPWNTSQVDWYEWKDGYYWAVNGAENASSSGSENELNGSGYDRNDTIMSTTTIARFQWNTLLVDEVVRDWISGAADYRRGIILQSNTAGGDWSYFYSKEGNASFTPYLQIPFSINYTMNQSQYDACEGEPRRNEAYIINFSSDGLHNDAYYRRGAGWDNSPMYFDPPLGDELYTGSIEFWIKPYWDGFSGGRGLWGADIFNLVSLTVWGDYLNLTYNSTYGNITANVSDWQDSEWHFVAFTWNDGEFAKLYVDGALRASTQDPSVSIGHPISNWWFGASMPSISILHPLADFDELRVLTYARNDSQILYDYLRAREHVLESECLNETVCVSYSDLAWTVNGWTDRDHDKRVCMYQSELDCTNYVWAPNGEGFAFGEYSSGIFRYGEEYHDESRWNFSAGRTGNTYTFANGGVELILSSSCEIDGINFSCPYYYKNITGDFNMTFEVGGYLVAGGEGGVGVVVYEDNDSLAWFYAKNQTAGQVPGEIHLQTIQPGPVVTGAGDDLNFYTDQILHFVLNIVRVGDDYTFSYGNNTRDLIVLNSTTLSWLDPISIGVYALDPINSGLNGNLYFVQTSETEHNLYECCGDDSGEIVKERNCSTGACVNDSSDFACCNNQNDCVYDATCYTSRNSTWIGYRQYYCNNTILYGAPEINFSVSAYNVYPGSPIEVVANWTDQNGWNTQLLVSDDIDFTSCSYDDVSGCLCNNSASTNTINNNCTFNVNSTLEVGTQVLYYVRACNEIDLCSTVVEYYNFSGVENPSSTHNATNGTYDAAYPTYPLSGTEFTTSDYYNISHNDTLYSSHNLTGGDTSDDFVYHQFIFSLNYNNSYNFLGLNYTGNGTNDATTNGYTIRLWNSTVFESQYITTSDTETSAYVGLTGNVSRYVNGSNHSIIYVSSTGAQPVPTRISLSTNYIGLTTHRGAYYTVLNLPPTLSSRYDNITSGTAGPNDYVFFNASWSDPNSDPVALFVTNATDFTNCWQEDTSMCLCNTSGTLDGNASCTWQIHNQTGDFIYYLRVCDDNNNCSDYIEHYNFTGVTNPSTTTHFAMNGSSGSVDWSTQGVEASTNSYNNISLSDNQDWTTTTKNTGYLVWNKVTFNLNHSADSYAHLNATVEAQSTGGVLDTGFLVQAAIPTNYYSYGSYLFTTSSDSEVTAKVNITNPAYYINSTQQINFLIRGAALGDVLNSLYLNLDFVSLDAWVGGSFTIENHPPRIINVSVNETLVPLGANLTFFGYWIDDEEDAVQMFISNTTTFANCNASSQTSCFCNTSLMITGNASCNFSTTGSQSGTTRWYARLCDHDQTCTTVYKHINFSNASNNTQIAYADEGYNASYPSSALFIGNATNHTNLGYVNKSDGDMYNYSYNASYNQFEWQQFRFNLSEYDLEGLQNSSVSFNLLHEGYASTECSAGIRFYMWNDSSTSYSYVSENTEYVEIDTNFTFYQDQGVYVNDEGLLYFTTVSRDYSSVASTGDCLDYCPECPKGSIHADYVALEAWVGGLLITDNLPPACSSLTIVDVNNTLYGHFANNTWYYNNDSGSYPLYFNVTLTTTDDSDMNTTDFPDTTSAGVTYYDSETTHSQLYNWTNASIFNQSANITVIDNFNNVGVCNFSVHLDHDPPSSGSFQVPNGTTSGGTINFSAVWPTDDLSGVYDQSYIYLSLADYNPTTGTCGAYGNYTLYEYLVYPSTSVSLSLYDQKCHNFTWEVRDYVGNYVNYTNVNITTTDFCSPPAGWDIVSQTVNCSNMAISVKYVNVSSGGRLNLWNVTLNTTYLVLNASSSDARVSIYNSNNSIWMDQHLEVFDGEHFTLSNSTMYMNATKDGASSIYCYSGSYCTFTDYSTVTYGISRNRYKFLVFNESTFFLNTSSILECGYDTDPYERGLTIESQKAIINNATIDRNYNSLVFRNGSTALVINTTLDHYDTGKAIVVEGSTTNASLLNMSVPDAILNITAGRLNIMWYVRAYAKDFDDEKIIGVNVTVQDSEGQFIDSGVTDSQGMTPYMNLTEYYVTSSGNTYLTNHTFNGTSSDRRGRNTSINITGSTTVFLVLNTKPTQSSPLLLPSPAYENENLVCYNQSTDDLDTENTTNVYNWLLNGTSQLLLNMPFDVEMDTLMYNSVKDYSGLDNNGTLGNLKEDNYPYWMPEGKVGGAYYFNVYGFINITDDTSLSDLTNFSIDFWAKPNNVGGTYAKSILSTTDDGFPTGSIMIRQNEDDLQVLVQDSSTGGTPFMENVFHSGYWVHFCLVMDADNNLTGYVNGTWNATDISVASSPYLTTAHNFYIGTYGTYEGSQRVYFEGYLDNFRIWNLSLSGEQCRQLYLDTKDGNTHNATIIADMLSEYQNWTCQVTPNDAWQMGATSSTSALINRVYGCGEEVIESYTLQSDLTSTSGETDCLRITADNIVLDCNGHKITGNQSLGVDAIGLNGQSNITIKNCRIYNFSQTLQVIDSDYITVYNNSMLESRHVSESVVTHMYNVYFEDSKNINITDLNIHNLSTGRNSQDNAGGFIYGLSLIGTNYTHLSNVSIRDLISEYMVLGLERNASYAIYATPRVDLFAEHIDIQNITYEGYGYYKASSTSENLTIHYLSVNNSYQGFSSLSSHNIFSLNLNNIRNIGVLISADVLLNLSNFNISNVKVEAISFNSGSDNHIIRNGRIDNSNRGIYIYHPTDPSLNNNLENILLNNTDYAIYGHIENSTFRNITSYNDNTSIYLHGSTYVNFNDSLFEYETTDVNFIDLNSYSQNITFLNTTANFSDHNADAEDSTNYTIKWYLRINVTDSIGNPIENATVNVTDTNGYNRIFENTTTTGLTNWTIITDRDNSDPFIALQWEFYNNHTINVTKEGYFPTSVSYNFTESQTYNVVLNPNTAPHFNISELTPTTAYTNTTINCTVNVTDSEHTTLTVNISWFRNGVNIKNESNSSYIANTTVVYNLTSNYTHYNDNITCEIWASDGEQTNATNVSTLIQNYTTVLNVSNINGSQYMPVFFYANYSNEVFGDLGRILWNTTGFQSDIQDVAFFDYNQDGKKQALVIGLDYINLTDIAAYKNGQELWIAALATTYDLEVADLDNDTFSDNIVLGTDTDPINSIRVLNHTGGVNWSSVSYGDEAPAIAIGDVNGDGWLDIVAGDDNSTIIAYNGTGNGSDNILWRSASLYGKNNWTHEIVLVDIDGQDGLDIVVGFERFGASANYTALNGSTGIALWNHTQSDNPALNSIDLLNDSTRNEILLSASNGMIIAVNTLTGSEYWNITPGTADDTVEIIACDINNDGYENDFVFHDTSTGLLYAYTANTTNATPLWNISLGTNIITSIYVDDFNDDGYIDILANDRYNSNFLINNSGDIIQRTNISGGAGIDWPTISRGRTLDSTDINDDGTNEYSYAGGENQQAFIMREVNCIIRFNDSYSSNMTWNITSGLWEYNHTFTTIQNYTYNITCEKGAYETQVSGNEVLEIGENRAPQIVLANITPDPAYTNDTLTCNYNITDPEEETLTVNITLYKNGVELYNTTGISYTQSSAGNYTLRHNYTHHNNNITCEVWVTDGYSTNMTNASTVIQNYTTVLNYTNTTGAAYEQIYFYANYSNEVFGDVGNALWNSSDLGSSTYAVSFYDCNNDSQRNCFALGKDYTVGSAPELIFYNSSGEILKTHNLFRNILDIKAYDFNEDGYEEVVVGSSDALAGILVYHSNGTEWWNSSNDINQINYVAIGDIDEDGSADVVGAQEGNYHTIFAFNYSGTNLWNYSYTTGNSYRGLIIGNFSSGGKVAYGKRGGGFGVLNASGNETWRSLSDTSTGDVNVINLDEDGYDELLIGADLLGYDDEGTQLWSLDFVDDIRYEIEAADIDNDNETEFIVNDRTGELKAYHANTTNATLEWNFTWTAVDSGTVVMSIIAGDVNDEDTLEVVFGGMDNKVFVVNASGYLVNAIPVNGSIGITHYDTTGGRHPAIDISDWNNDGIGDFIVGVGDNHTYIMQTVKCTIRFNDSVSANMTWNYTTHLWEYNRNFSDVASYEYNITCEKAGYEPQVSSNEEITITENTAPQIVSATLSPDPSYTNDTITCNFNITDAEEADLTVNVSWYRDSLSIQNITGINYTASSQGNVTLNHNLTHHNNNITCEITVTDTYNTNATNASLTVQNYSTSIAVSNTSSSVGRQIFFYANYSKDGGFDVQGITPEIGSSVWESGLIGYLFKDVDMLDLDESGIRDDIAISYRSSGGNQWGFMALYANGTQRFNSSSDTGNFAYQLYVFDADNDSYYDEVVLRHSGSEGYVVVYNRTGGIIWNTSNVGGLYDLAVGDFDGLGGQNDIAFAVKNATTFAHHVLMYNSSDGLNWSLGWISPTLATTEWNYEFEEVLAADIDNDGTDDVIAVDDLGMHVFVFNGSNGEWIYNTTQLTDATGHSLTIADIDHDGSLDDVVSGHTDYVYVSNFNGTYGSNYSESYIYDSTSMPFGVIREIRSLDYDLDGYTDDYVFSDGGNWADNEAFIRMMDNNSESIWNYSFSKLTDSTPGVYSLQVMDWDDDLNSEIIFSHTQDDNVTVLNISGNRTHYIDISQGDIGDSYGQGGGIHLGDLNNDGINDLLVVTEDGYAFAYQEATCTILFNDSTSAEMKYNVTSKLWEYNRSFTSATGFNYNITCSKGGYELKNITETGTIDENPLPVVETPIIEPIPAYTNDTLNCSTVAYDNESATITVEFTWYNLSSDGSTWEVYVSQNFTTTNATSVNFTLNPWQFQDRNDTWNCSVRAFDGLNSSEYRSNSTFINNTKPGSVNLTYPQDGDQFFTDLQPMFNWTDAFDLDNDTMYYRMQLAYDDAFSSLVFDIDQINTSNYTWYNDLPIFTTYYWRVQANDTIDNGSWSNISNFTLEPDVTISLIVSTIDFGLLELGAENDTTDENPGPFQLQNDGNTFANISINATPMWLAASAPLNTSYFQFKANQSSEHNSFNWSASAQDWLNMSNVSTLVIVQLNHSNVSDLAYIDIRVASSLDEPPGAKNSTIEFTSRQHE